MRTIEELTDILTEPTEELVQLMKRLDGDILILGVSGKMGPSLAILAKKAIERAGVKKRVIGAARFSDPTLRDELEHQDIETVQADLLDEDDLERLPKIKNILFMAGRKFGTSGNEAATWAMNAYVPGRVANTFPDSRMVIFSSGNIYPFVDRGLNGADENKYTEPIGEYAQSILARERVFKHFNETEEIPMLFYRLNYAVEMRYGVLLEIAQSVYHEQPIDLTTGAANVIWQGDANHYALFAFEHCTTPATILNITGPETFSVRWVAERFAMYFGTQAKFHGVESETALLNNASKAHQLFGYPSVPLRQIMEWTVEWLQNDGVTLDKPTHFQERKGEF